MRYWVNGPDVRRTRHVPGGTAARTITMQHRVAKMHHASKSPPPALVELERQRT